MPQSDCIERLDENKWKWIWRDNIFQGIKSNKALDNVLKNNYMHIKSCFASIDNAHLTIFQQLHNFKDSRKGVIKSYSKISTLPYPFYITTRLQSLSTSYKAGPKLFINKTTTIFQMYFPSAHSLIQYLKVIK